MVFWHQSTLCKVINQAANSVNSDLPAFSSVQATSLWRVLYHKRAKSLSRKLRNEGAKVHSMTFWSFYRDLLQKGRIKQTLLLNDIVTSSCMNSCISYMRIKQTDFWWKWGLKLHFITLPECQLTEALLHKSFEIILKRTLIKRRELILWN